MSHITELKLAEPTLAELLAADITQLVMRSDRVDPKRLEELSRSAAKAIRSRTDVLERA